MKTFYFIFALFISSTLTGQSFCVEKIINPITPAPCSIEGHSDTYDGWLVQVGVYRQFVQPREDTFAYFFMDDDGGFFSYYIDKNYTEGQAKAAAIIYRSLGFCDAIAKINPVKVYLFIGKGRQL